MKWLIIVSITILCYCAHEYIFTLDKPTPYRMQRKAFRRVRKAILEKEGGKCKEYKFARMEK